MFEVRLNCTVGLLNLVKKELGLAFRKFKSTSSVEKSIVTAIIKCLLFSIEVFSCLFDFFQLREVNILWLRR